MNAIRRCIVVALFVAAFAARAQSPALAPGEDYLEIPNGMPLDPSSPDRPKSSKIVIDATKQWPEEGGPKVYPERNRDLLAKLAPGAIAAVDAKWDEYVAAWKHEGCPPRYP